MANLILQTSLIMSLTPLPTPDFELPVFTPLYNEPIQTIFFNHNAHISKIDLTNQNNNITCNCNDSLPDTICHPDVSTYGKHFCTTDPSIFPNDTLQLVFSKTPQFRLSTSTTKSEAIMIISNTLDEYWLKTCTTHSDYQRWKILIVQKLNTTIIPTTTSELPDWITAKSLKKIWRQLTNHVVCCPADKLRYSWIFICPKLYASLCINHISKSGCYALTQLSQNYIIDMHSSFSQQILGTFPKPPVTFPKLGMLYGTIKYLKDLAPIRPITPQIEVSMTSADTYLSIGLRHILNSLQLSLEIENPSAKLYTPITGLLELLPLLPKTSESVFSFDIKSMFDVLPHHLISEIINPLIYRVFSEHPNQYLDIVSTKKHYTIAAWRPYRFYKKHNTSHFDALKLCELLLFVVTHNFITFGMSILRQICGIPMGGHSSPAIADLYCLGIELIIFQTLPETSRFFFRYIDDILFFNISLITFNTHFLPLYTKYGLHPVINKENTGITVPFLDIRVTIEKGDVSTTHYRKTELNTLFPHYSDYDTAINPSTIYNTFSTMAITIYRANTFAHNFLIQLHELILYVCLERFWSPTIIIQRTHKLLNTIYRHDQHYITKARIHAFIFSLKYLEHTATGNGHEHIH
eukprot:Lithocolla_globosa_v1_NODE_378_length_4234_cov_4.842344.p1 type:complete len:635 gc:universal NODE_378_length_4234_cov_4.842344:1723-3627(+)